MNAIVRRSVGIAAIMLLGTPAAALAAKPSPPKVPTVMYVLHGKLSSYTAAVAGTSVNGTISITVSASNRESAILKGQLLTFVVTPKTNVVLHKGNAVTNGDRGIVKIRAPKSATAAALETFVVFQVIDQGTKA